MYLYERKKNNTTWWLIAGISLCLLVLVGFLFQDTLKQQLKEAGILSNEEIPVITLPDVPGEPVVAPAEKAARPYQINAEIVAHYFDYEKSDDILAMAVTEFEGVYRPNQGVDYGYENKAFEVSSIFSGTVTEVKEDALFGQSISITSENLVLTYQSLADVKVQKGDFVMQNQIIATSGENIYHKDLGIHLHLVAQKNGQLIDPTEIFDKTIAEIN